MAQSSKLKAHNSKILITGSIAYDLLLSYEGSFADALKQKSMDRLSVSFFAPHMKRHHGGTGSNITWNLRLLGGDPLLVGTVGTDGGSYCALMEERGIDTKHVERRKDSITATAIIGTDNGERQIAFFHPGADALGTWPTATLSDDCDDIAWAIVGARNPVLMMEAVRWCDKAGLPLLFDPAQQIIALSTDELRSAVAASRGVICNEYEWSVLSERTEMQKKDIVKTAEFLIVTLGDKGVALHSKKGTENISACIADQVVNPTGAGDAFRAGLLFGLEKKWDLSACCKLGAAMGSKVVEIEGTLMESLDLEEVWERARKAYGDVLPK
ncbi:MAG: adenosine kinase [Candidatus Peregrinibacteria bacterium Greene1014_49]|nr:MAG: adenosine kinase [Candidatus Peregrinibacteria bacterium Greene1014_49]